MKLNYKQTIFVGFAFLAICTFWQVYDNEIPLILEKTFSLKPTVIGVIMALDNIFALFLLPMFGTMSDRTKTKLGKRMPFILVGTIVASALLILLAYSEKISNLILFVAVLLLLLVAMGSFRSPAVALMPDVTCKPLRSKANAIINLMGTIGGIFALLFIKFLKTPGERPSYFPLFGAVSAVMLISLVILLLTTNENKLSQQREKIDLEIGDDQLPEEENGEMSKEVKRSLIFLLISVALWYIGYNALTSAFSRYYQNYWGIENSGYSSLLMIATVAAVLSYIPVGIIATKVGRKKTILVGVVILACSFAGGIFFKSYSPLVKIFFATVGIGWGTINVNSYPMVVEMSKGSDIGKFTGYYYTFSMAAQVITPILSGLLIEKIGYGILFPYATFFAAMAFVTMLQVKHGDAKTIEKKDLLEHFDIDD
ncbi:MAG: MFS transporter [Erysipelotrichia bacterium]|nr:MFS transporter [Erysipelotrichia bacterium]